MKRPLRIVLISWYAILYGIVVVLSSLLGLYYLMDQNEFFNAYMEEWELPPEAQVARGLSIGSAHFVAGFFMLKQRRWARILMLGVLGIAFLLYLYDSPYLRRDLIFMPIFQIGFFVILFALLLTPKSRSYFNNSNS